LVAPCPGTKINDGCNHQTQVKKFDYTSGQGPSAAVSKDFCVYFKNKISPQKAMQIGQTTAKFCLT